MTDKKVRINSDIEPEDLPTRKYRNSSERRDREARLIKLHPRERAASLEHEIRMAMERQRLIEIDKLRQLKITLALNPHQDLHIPNDHAHVHPRKGRRHSSLSDGALHHRKPKHKSRKRRSSKSKRGKAKRNSVTPAPETAVVTKDVPEKEADDEVELHDSSDDSSSSSDSEELVKPKVPPPAKAAKTRANIWWHYHHKDGRRDNVRDETEQELAATTDCQTLHHLRNAKIKQYVDDELDKVRRVQEEMIEESKEMDELEKKMPKIKRQKRLSLQADQLKFKEVLQHHVVDDPFPDTDQVEIPEYVADGLRSLRFIKNIFMQHKRFKNKKWWKCDVTNLYQFVNRDGRDLFRFIEEIKADGCLGTYRNINYSVYSSSDEEVGAIRKMSNTLLHVYSPPDNLLGFVTENLVKPRITIQDQQGAIYAEISLEPRKYYCRYRNKIFTISTSLGAPRGRIRGDWDDLPNTHIGLHFPDETSLTIKLLIMAATMQIYSRHYKQRSIWIDTDPRMKDPADELD